MLIATMRPASGSALCGGLVPEVEVVKNPWVWPVYIYTHYMFIFKFITIYIYIIYIFNIYIYIYICLDLHSINMYRMCVCIYPHCLYILIYTIYTHMTS